MDLDARPFYCFIAVAEERSFTRAAVKLNLSQPALSGQIRELERRLGFSLFTRTSRHVELTIHARQFLPNARRIVLETSILRRAARDILTNELRLGAASLTELIPERRKLIENLMLRHPKMPFDIQNDSHARLIDRLTRLELDVVLSIEPPLASEAAKDGPIGGLVAEEGGEHERLFLAERTIKLLLPIDHPLSGLPEIPLEAIRNLPIAVLNRSHGIRLAETIFHRLVELGADLVRPPEGHAIAVEQYGQLRGIAAVSLGWFDPLLTGLDVRNIVHRPVMNLELSTCFVLIRQVRNHRPAADEFWREAERQKEAL